ncbi:DUF5518 domain-containing protein [Natrialba asiatica]|uniref:DUF5518 domain-containing protein n=1 Tax=Natrialba asiatica TaxID=64602 RepID=UPI0013763FC7
MASSDSRNILNGLTEGSFGTAILLGLASVPLTLIVSRESTTLVHGGPMIAVGLIVGYLYDGRSTDSHRAGLICGFASSIGGIMAFGTGAVTKIPTPLTESSVIEIVTIPFVFILLALCFATLVMICAMVGNWLATISPRF